MGPTDNEIDCLSWVQSDERSDIVVRWFDLHLILARCCESEDLTALSELSIGKGIDALGSLIVEIVRQPVHGVCDNEARVSLSLLSLVLHCSWSLDL